MEPITKIEVMEEGGFWHWEAMLSDGHAVAISMTFPTREEAEADARNLYPTDILVV